MLVRPVFCTFSAANLLFFWWFELILRLEESLFFRFPACHNKRTEAACLNQLKFTVPLWIRVSTELYKDGGYSSVRSSFSVLTQGSCLGHSIWIWLSQLSKLGESDKWNATIVFRPWDFEGGGFIRSNKQEESLSHHLHLSGWGKTDYAGQAVQDLQHASLQIISNKECCEANCDRWTPSIPNKMVCAKNREQANSGCHGDSGGPFVCQGSNGRWSLQGVVSWGSGRCNAFQKATVFTRVSEYMAWINETIKNN